MTAWSNRQEREYVELQRRITAMTAERLKAREPVEALRVKMYGETSNAHEVTDWLIANADQVRDVLQPFDSGTRWPVPGLAPAPRAPYTS